MKYRMMTELTRSRILGGLVRGLIDDEGVKGKNGFGLQLPVIETSYFL